LLFFAEVEWLDISGYSLWKNDEEDMIVNLNGDVSASESVVIEATTLHKKLYAIVPNFGHYSPWDGSLHKCCYSVLQ